MEELSALERSDASVVTPSRLIGIHDIERMYTARKSVVRYLSPRTFKCLEIRSGWAQPTRSFSAELLPERPGTSS